jgi:nucleoid DNA-binding protein
MTKRELVIRVANKLGMTQNDVAKIVEGMFDAISRNLADGHRWELRDFGVFEVKTRASRIGRNPRTGEQVPVPERRVVTFRPGKRMKEIVSGQEPSEPAESLMFPESGEGQRVESTGSAFAPQRQPGQGDSSTGNEGPRM